MLRRLLLAFTMVLLAFSCIPMTHSRDGGALRTPTGGKFHWTHDAFPIPVACNPNLSQANRSAMLFAIETWNLAVGYDMLYFYDAPATFPMFADNGEFARRGYIAVDQGIVGNDPSGRERLAYAKTNLFKGFAGSRGKIHSVYILMGEDLSAEEYVDYIAVHELGHALGLAHDYRDIKSIMWRSVRPDQVLRPEDVNYVRSQLPPRGDVEYIYLGRNTLP